MRGRNRRPIGTHRPALGTGVMRRRAAARSGMRPDGGGVAEGVTEGARALVVVEPVELVRDLAVGAGCHDDARLTERRCTSRPRRR